jgi:hypothetical protein
LQVTSSCWFIIHWKGFLGINKKCDKCFETRFCKFIFFYHCGIHVIKFIFNVLPIQKKYFWSLECNTSCKAGMRGVPNLLVSHSGNCLFKTSLLLPPIIIIITMVIYWALLLETKYIIQNNTINSMFHILFFLFIHKLLSFFLLLPRDKFFNITFSFFIHDLFYFKWNLLDA